ncbi:MAG: hypothetical protein IKP07_04180 [Bacilli bacterium]|nr:hypothetical protein [Bacilli bacterium]
MKVTVDFDEVKCANSFKPGYNRARSWLKNEVAKDTNVFTPFRSGTLRDSVLPTVDDPNDYLVWSVIYASYQYYGSWADGSHVITQHSQPGTDTYYFEKAKAVHKAKWVRVARKLAGGRY